MLKVATKPATATPPASSGTASSGTAPSRTAPASRTRGLRPVRGAALWTTIGFVCGAIFWHSVGFWTFMSEMMFNGDAAAAQHEVGLDSDSIETGSLPTIYRIDPASCTSLALDRLSNRTEARPCPADGLALRLNSEKTRGDLDVMAENSPR